MSNFFSTLFPEWDQWKAQDATAKLAQMKAQSDAAGLIQQKNQTQAQAKLLGLTDPYTGVTWDQPPPATGNYQYQDQSGNWQTAPIIPGPQQGQGVLGSAPPNRDLAASAGQQIQSEQSGLFNRAFPDLASMSARLGSPAFQTAFGGSPGTQGSNNLGALGQLLVLDPTGKQAAELIKANATIGDKQKLTQYFNSLPDGDPNKELLRPIFAHESGLLTDPREIAKTQAQTSEAQAATAKSKAELGVVGAEVSKDAYGNPVIVNKANGATTDIQGIPKVGDAQVESLAQQIANYQKKPPAMSAGRTSPFMLTVMDRVREINPEYDERFYNSSNKAYQDFATGPDAARVRQANAAMGHLSLLLDYGSALDNGNIQLANTIKNKLSSEFGGQSIAGYNSIAPFVGQEVAKFIMGGQSSAAERNEFAAPLSAAASQPQRQAAAGAMTGAMATQLRALQRQYETSTGRKDFSKLLDPGVANVLNDPRFAEGAGPAGQRNFGGINAQSVPSVQLPGDVQALVNKYKSR